jgi:hypothetical protein
LLVFGLFDCTSAHFAVLKGHGFSRAVISVYKNPGFSPLGNVLSTTYILEDFQKDIW